MTYKDALRAALCAAREKDSPQASGLAVALNMFTAWEYIGGPTVDDCAVIDNDLMLSGCPRCER